MFPAYHHFIMRDSYPEGSARWRFHDIQLWLCTYAVFDGGRRAP